jgi:hypothetical protein
MRSYPQKIVCYESFEVRRKSKGHASDCTGTSDNYCAAGDESIYSVACSRQRKPFSRNWSKIENLSCS